MRASVDGARLREVPTARGDVVEGLARHTPARVEAVTGDFYRVTLPDGRRGFLSSRAAEAVDDPIRETERAAAAVLLTAPERDAPVLARAAPGEALPILGTFGSYALVRGPTGRDGWLLDAPRATDDGQ